MKMERKVDLNLCDKHHLQNLEWDMKVVLKRFMLVVFLAALMVGCGSKLTPTVSPPAPTPQFPIQPPTAETIVISTTKPEPTIVLEEGGPPMEFVLSSPAFTEGDPIPEKYSCDGEDISPPLQWTDPPKDTLSFALIADDPDAPVGTWVHWVLYNLPADTRSVPEAFPSDAELPDGTKSGENSWQRLGYGGPCPPSGTHRYFFTLFALDTILEMTSGATKDQLLQAMEEHILAEIDLMGTYTR
jgi:Raf kinase inhibitor-like YbhB/YbcL family protein